MAAQNCQKPSVTDDHDAQQDQDAGIWRSSSQNNVTGEMDCLTAAVKKDGQAESQVSCPRTIHNPLSHFQTLVSSQTQNLLTEVKASPLVKTATHGQGFLQPSRKWKSLSRVWLFATPWTIQSMKFSRPNTGVGDLNLSLLQGSSQPRDRSQISHFAGRFFTSWATWEVHEYWSG